jgi:TRAP-type C4-dicarboxylate transport system permease small subunit
MGSTFFLMCMTALHVILRKFTKLSVPGAMELTELSLVVIVFFAVAYLQTQGGHVRVDMLINKFPKRVQSFLEFVILLLSAVALFLMFYAAVLQVQSQFISTQATNVLLIPIWPFVIVMAIGLVLYAISILLQAITFLIAGIKGEETQKITTTVEV